MKKSVSSLLLALLLLLTACSTRTQQENGGQVAMGRYLEEELTLPEGMDYIVMLEQDAAGALVLIGVNQTGKWSKDLYRSEDGGRSWEQQNPDWWSELGRDGPQAATLAPDGSLLLLVQQFSAEDQKIIDAIYAAWDAADSDPDDQDPVWDLVPPDGDCVLYRGDAGGLTLLEGFVPEKEFGPSVRHIRVGASGDIVGTDYFALMHLDRSGTPIETIPTNTMTFPGIFKVLDDTLVYPEGDNIILYDLGSGMRIEEISGPVNPVPSDITGSYSHSQRAVAVDPEEMAFYLCDSSGIYRTLTDGSVSERLMDGDLSSLVMSTVCVMDLFLQDDGSFLVLTWTQNDGYGLLRYYFDPDTTTVPDGELRVYALHDNPTVRQAIGMYQRVNPSVKVTYQVGITGESAMTEADAMRLLSTELLAGSGPDLLVLDGMPVEGYIRQGLLLDLREPLSGLLASGDLVDNVVDTWRREDGLWAIPARFSVPMLNAGDEAMQKIHSLEDLADWVENAETHWATSGDLLLEELYPLCIPLWFDTEGALNKDAMALSLQSIRRIANAPVFFSEHPDLAGGAVCWSAGMLSASFATLYDIGDIKFPEAAIEKLGEGDLAVLDNGRGGVFIPSTTMGVNGTGQTGLALHFLEYLLSPEVLQYSFSDGLPVSREALQHNMINPYAAYNTAQHSVAITREGEYIRADLEAPWPSEAFFQQTLDQITSVTTAAPVDLVIRDMVMAEAVPYLEGDQTLEDAVNEFAQKYSLYLAEQN